MRLSPPECPKCRYELSWRDLGGEFECPGCKAQLKSNYLGVFIFVIVVLPVPFMLYIPSDTVGIIFISGALLMAASVWVFAKLVYVRLAHDSNAT
jgi:hypothetical protein